MKRIRRQSGKPETPTPAVVDLPDELDGRRLSPDPRPIELPSIDGQV
jgi:hypothetical protein